MATTASIPDSTPTPFRILQSKSLSDLVRDEVMQLIVSGKYAPGSKLGEDELAERLGVSRGPVREAFRCLEEAGLVRLAKNRGVFVREFTLKEAEDLYIVRAGMDEMIGRLVAPKIGDDDLDQLRKIVDRMKKSQAANAVSQYFALDAEFHDRIAQLSGNNKLLSVHRSVSNEMQIVRLQSIKGAGGMMAAHHEHNLIVEKLASRDKRAAAKVMSNHIMHAFQRVAPLLGDGSSFE